MYNPSRGGVRGGADQFTWESVKNDKHRENYLGHSLMAPVGRWQKGKDLSWYAKERKDDDGSNDPNKGELASIKRAEEEAMLIALGHNIVRKETQKLSKEDIREALKRNTGERDDHSIERIDGVGVSSKRLAILSNVGNDHRSKTEGVTFEGYREKMSDRTENNEKQDDSLTEERKKSQKKSKKHKKEKKCKKRKKESNNSDSDEGILKHRSKHRKNESDSDNKKSSTHKKSKHKRKDYSSDDSDSKNISEYRKKGRRDESDSDERNSVSKIRSKKKSKHRHKDYSSDDAESKNRSYSQHESYKRNEKQSGFMKRSRHDTSESD